MNVEQTNSAFGAGDKINLIIGDGNDRGKITILITPDKGVDHKNKEPQKIVLSPSNALIFLETAATAVATVKRELEKN